MDGATVPREGRQFLRWHYKGNGCENDFWAGQRFVMRIQASQLWWFLPISELALEMELKWQSPRGFLGPWHCNAHWRWPRWTSVLKRAWLWSQRPRLGTSSTISASDLVSLSLTTSPPPARLKVHEMYLFLAHQPVATNGITLTLMPHFFCLTEPPL